MGGLVSSLGLGGGGSTGEAGTKFAAEGAPLENAFSANTAIGQLQNVNKAQDQNQNFINALMAQNGIQNQSDVYNQLSQIAQGQGPNPAQAMLNQATGANVANQAALMAGQRGSGANSGLIARQAAQQGGSLQQQAAAQSAVNQANQSLGAINTMGGVAAQQVGQLQNANQYYTQNALQSQGNVYSGLGAQNNANVGMRSNQNTANAGIANTVAQGQQGLASGVLQGAGAVMALARGGEVPSYAYGGATAGSTSLKDNLPSNAIKAPNLDPNSPSSKVGQFFKGAGNGGMPEQPGNVSGSMMQKGASDFGQGLGKGLRNLFASNSNPNTFAADESQPMAGGALDNIGDISELPIMAAAHGGKVPALVSPGEVYIPPSKVKAAAKGEELDKVGEKIPGKAEVAGDSLKNDKVKKTLEAGGMVIPRSIMQSKDAEKKAAAFVKEHLRKKGYKSL